MQSPVTVLDLQQSSLASKSNVPILDPQLSEPQTRLPAHWLSLSQSPSPSEQGLASVQQSLSAPLHLKPSIYPNITEWLFHMIWFGYIPWLQSRSSVNVSEHDTEPEVSGDQGLKQILDLDCFHWLWIVSRQDSQAPHSLTLPRSNIWLYRFCQHSRSGYSYLSDQILQCCS